MQFRAGPVLGINLHSSVDKIDFSNIFKRFPKTKSSRNFQKTAANHVSYLPVTHVITSSTLHNSIFIQRYCLQYFRFPRFV